MMRRVSSTLMVTTTLLSSWACSAELPEKWRLWRYSRVVQAQSADSDGRSVLTLPWEIFAHCGPGCADVRIVDSRGEEVPFVMEERHASRNVESKVARIIENSFVAGKYTQIIGDLGEAQTYYDSVKVETSRPDFIVWAEVALSDDAKTWRIVETRAPIARFRSREVDGTQTVAFQGLSSRYVRVRIAEPSGQFPVHGISVLQEQEYKPRTIEVPAALAEEKSTDATASLWRITLASPNQPVSELEINTDTAEFYRGVRISGSSDGKQWSYWGSGVVYRYTQAGKVRESLRVEFPETVGNRLLRVEVINGNDLPLTNLTFTLAATPRTLILKEVAGHSYRLLYGNEKATTPQYDLARYLDSGATRTVSRILSLGPEEETTNYRDPRPFTERHPEVLWSALAVAIVLIGLTALKTLRAPVNTSPQN
jgi:hypothetical protein